MRGGGLGRTTKWSNLKFKKFFNVFHVKFQLWGGVYFEMIRSEVKITPSLSPLTPIYHHLLTMTGFLTTFCPEVLCITNRRLLVYQNFRSETRMHSSRMLTTLSLLYRGVFVQGRFLSRGSLCRGSLSRGGVSVQGVSVQGGSLSGRPPLWTESQTGVNTLPCRNFVAGGNNVTWCKWELRSVHVMRMKTKRESHVAKAVFS